jgi:hypothetical protein
MSNVSKLNEIDEEALTRKKKEILPDKWPLPSYIIYIPFFPVNNERAIFTRPHLSYLVKDPIWLFILMLNMLGISFSSL